VSEFDVPPLGDDARALLERVKGTEPAPAPKDVRARVFEQVVRTVGSPAGREAFQSGVRAQEVTTRARARRSWRAAAWLAAAAAFALAALRFGGRFTASRDRDRRQAAPLAAEAPAACSPVPSLDGDPHNCGRCGHDCCGGACSGGVCQLAVIAQAYHPGKLAVDATHVYWPDGSDSLGRIMKVPKRGGESVELASGIYHPWAVAVDGTHAYWVTNSDVGPSFGGVFKVPLEGGDAVPLVASGEAFAGDILVNATHVYWDDYGAYAPGQHRSECAPGARIRRAGLDGSNPTTLADASAGVCTPLYMALDAHNVYWPSRFGRVVQTIGHDGAGLARLSRARDPYTVAVDSFYVYWTNWDDGTIQRAPLSGGDAVTLASSGQARGPNRGVGATMLAVDSTHVFWTRQGPPWGSSGAVLVAPLSGLEGSTGSVLATSPNASWLATDAACVYWVDASDGQIRAVAKP
jgi:hypothetical protein